MGKVQKLIVGNIYLLVMIFLSNFAMGQFNPGAENIIDANTVPVGWSQHSTSGTLEVQKVSATPRSGSNAILVQYTSSSGTTKYQHDDYSVTVPSTGFNVHVIGWLSSTNSNSDDRVALGIKRITATIATSENSLVNETTSYVQHSRTWTNPGAGTYVPLFIGNSNSGSFSSIKNMRGDDFIIYYNTLGSPDLTVPLSPTSLCVNTSGNDNILTWSDGADDSNVASASGIDGVLILRAAIGTATTTVLNQANYSLSPLIGPNTIGSWTVLHNGASTGTFTDANAAGQPYIYAVYMRDKAFNYSTAPATYTTANAGADQTLACAVYSTNLAATAATGGIWSLQSGGGTIASNSSANSNVSSMPDGTNTFQWTVTNAGCSTYDRVNIYVSSGIVINGFPLNDTVFNQLGNASFGVSTNPPVGTSYQWQVSTNGGSTWSNLSNGGFYSGVTSSILQVTNPTYAMNGYQYRCSVSNGCASSVSPQATLAVLQIQTFSNTTAQSCGTNFSNTWGTFERTVTVSGLPTPLATTSGKYVLRQIDLKLGSPTCKKDLSTYQARIISPNGTIIELFDNANSTNITTNSIWMDVKFRDHDALERLEQYQTSVQSSYFPYSIGYYAIQNDGDFNSVLNENPNGNWRLQIIENTATGNEISFESVKLYFGPSFSISDITSNTANDICTNAKCINSQEIIIGSNNGYSSSDPLFPGTTTGSCSWNGANNNSAWFKFVASSTTAYISLSGIRAVTTGNNDTQPIVFSMTSPCVSGYAVPSGGCPDDESVNNIAYKSTNGGITGAGNVYSNGITANTEFNLTGLTVGQTYYLYVDGNGGGASTFYIEMPNGCETCNTILPIELVKFDVTCNNEKITLNWSTATETNNSHFTILGSSDAIEWMEVGNVNVAGNSLTLINYNYEVPVEFSNLKYFKLAQTDFDGLTTYSSILFTDCDTYNQVDFFPNPFYNELNFKINSNESVSYEITTVLGQIVNSGTVTRDNNRINLEHLASDIYFIKINNSKVHKIIKQ